MMRKIFPALVAVIAVTATGCTHDDDQSGVPAATTAPSTPSVSASAAVHYPSPAASVSPSRSASPSRATASASRATSVAGASRGHETHGQGSSHPRHVSHARAAQPVPAHSSSRKPVSAHSSSRKPVSAHLSSGRVSRFAPGTSVAADVSQQVMVADRTSGTRGTWARYPVSYTHLTLPTNREV